MVRAINLSSEESDSILLAYLPRMCPLKDLVKLNLEFSASSITYRSFVIGLSSMLPTTFIYTALGAGLSLAVGTLSSSAGNFTTSPLPLIALLIAVVAVLCLTWLNVITERLVSLILEQGAEEE